MFATLPSPSPPHIFSIITPPSHRPYSSQCANPPRPFAFPMPQGNPNQEKETTRQPPSSTSPHTSYAQRYASQIRNPAARVAGRASHDVRRNAFLNRIKRGRENSMFSAREDSILWMDYVAQKQRFEEEMARSAPVLSNVEDEMMDIHEDDHAREDSDTKHNDQTRDDEAALEEYLAQEREYEAFLEEMESRIEANHTDSNQGEDEDYDRIFAEIASHYTAAISDPNEQMDMSHG
ncbi:hypothetical protein DIZ76_017563 [Coccidioides immitis]|nr:hypothetical protein CIRG_07704 [Coccidioides immitis RMSCC 2394]KMU79691.1 hypothetical protein CISG_02109 [Coccidioides immitis RMSCC 3703]TPX19771.1 hypothetical protein DIZ76_017563 [Coccidioides immitis]